MTIKDFESKYGIKGGVAKLTEFRSLYANQAFIASHFGVSRERVRQWMLEFFGSQYDPRSDRRDAIIEGMIDFAKNNPRKDFSHAFYSSEYYQLVLEKCKEQNIYGSTK